MEPRFSADIAGDTPLTFSKERIPLSLPLAEWVERIALGDRDPPPPPRVQGLSKDDGRVLCLRLMTAIEINVAPNPAWSKVYSALCPYTGSLSGNMEQGGTLGKGPFLVDQVFSSRKPGSGLGVLSSDHARLSLLSSALDELSSKEGMKAWLPRLLLQPSLAPWDSGIAGHWMLGLLDAWQTHGLVNEAAPSQDRIETTALAARCVSRLDHVLGELSPDEPLMWRQLARQVDLRLSFLKEQPRFLPDIEPYPVHIPPSSTWARPRPQGEAWRTRICMMLDWMKQTYTWPDTLAKRKRRDKDVSPKPVYPQLPLDALLSNATGRGLWSDYIADLARQSPRDQRPLIHASLHGFSQFAARRGDHALAAEPERILLEAFTAKARSVSRRGSRL